MRRSNSTPARRGVATVELAVALPTILVLLLGVWEVGRMLETQQILDGAARAGARQVAPHALSDAQIAQVVTDYLRDAGLAADQAQVTVENLDHPGADAAQAVRGDRLSVTVTFPLAATRLSTPYLVTGPNTRLTATAVWISAPEPN